MRLDMLETQDLQLTGMIQLYPGDFVFTRDPKVSTDPEQDQLAFAVTGP